MIIIKSSNNPIVDVLRPAQKLQVWNTYIPATADNCGILAFISMINTPSESLKARKVSIFQHFSFYEQLKFYAHLVEHENVL